MHPTESSEPVTLVEEAVSVDLDVRLAGNTVELFQDKKFLSGPLFIVHSRLLSPYQRQLDVDSSK